MKNNYYGFLEQKNIRSISKAEEELSKEITYSCIKINGENKEVTASKAEYIYMLAINGFTPRETKSENGKTMYIMKKGKSEFKTIKILADYAKYLITNDFFDTDEDDENDEISNDGGTADEIIPTDENKDEIKEDYNDSNESDTENEDDENNNDSDEDSEDDCADDEADNSNEADEENGIEDETDNIGNDGDETADSDLKAKNKKDNSAKISAKKDFEVKLMEEAAKYPDNEKAALLKKIFEAEAGVFDEHTKELLVLIDNFDKLEYKNALIDRLWNGNTVSRKVFECITGLELPITNKDIGKYFAALSTADFKKMSEYKPVTAAEHAKEKTFYIKGNKGFEKVQGYEYSTDGLELFIRYTQTEVVISDVKTGVMLAKGTNEAEAKDKLRSSIDKLGIDKIKSALANQEKVPTGKSKK